jgi:hypothetical protein
MHAIKFCCVAGSLGPTQIFFSICFKITLKQRSSALIAGIQVFWEFSSRFVQAATVPAA